MKMFNEFKKFAIKGNVIDLAVAVVISLMYRWKIMDRLFEDEA